MRPDYFIAGFYKCGTTTLYDILKQHRDILVSSEKENDFFMNEKLYRKGIKWYENKYYNGIEKKPGQVVLEINPHLSGAPKTAQRLKKYYPNGTKILFIMRNPIDMFYSHFKFSMQLGFYSWSDTKYCVQNGFSKAFDRFLKKYPEEITYFENKYSRQIKEYQRTFGEENIHCMFLEDMKRNNEAFLKELLDYFGIPWDETLTLSLKSNVSDAMPVHYTMLKCYAFVRKYYRKIPEEYICLKRLMGLIVNLLYHVYDKRNADYTQMSKSAERQLRKKFAREKCRIENITKVKLQDIWW